MTAKTPKPPKPPGHGAKGSQPKRDPKRGIGPDDRALWRQVTRDAVPLDPALRATGDVADPNPTQTEVTTARPPTPAVPKTNAPKASAFVAPRSMRPTGSDKKPSISIDLADRAIAPVRRLEAGLDGRLTERLRQGERAPDGRIDLHGMTAERAHRTLDSYIGAALLRGERLILVITGKGGKGRNADDAAFMRADQGVLRQQAPTWLRNGPYAANIVGIYQAHLRHGGAGAFYVYLKKQR